MAQLQGPVTRIERGTMVLGRYGQRRHALGVGGCRQRLEHAIRNGQDGGIACSGAGEA